MRAKFTFFLLLLGLYGCPGPTPERQEEIKSLRILAIRSEPPDAKPGQSVKLTALVANPSGNPVTWQWYACQSKSQANTGCVQRADATPLGTSPSQNYQIRSDFLPKDASLVDKFRGVYQPISLVVTSGSERDEAVKRVVVTELPLNQNPKLSNLAMYQSDKKLQDPLQYKENETYSFRPQIDANSIQSYFVLSPDGTLTTTKETLFLSWYITSGTLRGGRRSKGDKPNKSWVAPSTNEASIYVIVRDGRGGTTWEEKRLQRKP